ncbi:unnamed protein product [Pleuronectes platessa]|uniref:Uncharacterized protein n=1 Tax=Pleuronectes platessa TaxID=8262 RepID=A0A9N7V9Z4_PLEPL|nr:unnamed protein product [Pleuronectes platessa]
MRTRHTVPPTSPVCRTYPWTESAGGLKAAEGRGVAGGSTSQQTSAGDSSGSESRQLFDTSDVERPRSLFPNGEGGTGNRDTRVIREREDWEERLPLSRSGQLMGTGILVKEVKAPPRQRKVSDRASDVLSCDGADFAMRTSYKVLHVSKLSAMMATTLLPHIGERRWTRPERGVLPLPSRMLPIAPRQYAAQCKGYTWLQAAMKITDKGALS